MGADECHLHAVVVLVPAAAILLSPRPYVVLAAFFLGGRGSRDGGAQWGTDRECIHSAVLGPDDEGPRILFVQPE